MRALTHCQSLSQRGLFFVCVHVRHRWRPRLTPCPLKNRVNRHLEPRFVFSSTAPLTLGLFCSHRMWDSESLEGAAPRGAGGGLKISKKNEITWNDKRVRNCFAIGEELGKHIFFCRANLWRPLLMIVASTRLLSSWVLA